MAPSIPKKQWAQVIEKTGGPVEYKQIDTPTPGPEEVLVNIKYTGVCHTDLHAVNGDWPLPTKLPLVGGHEGAGYVVARGELVSDDTVKIGEAVGVKWLNGSCLSCDFCQQSDEPLCLKPTLSGYTVDGTFQQYCVAKAAHVAHIPEGVPLDAVAPILCAGITVYKGIKESGLRPGQSLAIVGAGGGLGSLAQQYAKAMGLTVIAIDTGDDKKAMSEKMGAEVGCATSTFSWFANCGEGLHRLCQIQRRRERCPRSHQRWAGPARCPLGSCHREALPASCRVCPTTRDCGLHWSTGWRVTESPGL